MPVTYTNKEEIANRALLKIGATGLVSFEDGSKESELVKQIYPTFVESQLASGQWRFAMKKSQLSRLTETPINEWKYVYQLPSDILGIRSLFNSDQVTKLTTNEFEVYQNRKVYSDETTLYLDYVSYPDESYWPLPFVEFVIAALASELAFPVTRDSSIEGNMRVLAYGQPSDNGIGGLYGNALYQDAQSNPQEALRLTHISNSRFSD